MTDDRFAAEKDDAYRALGRYVAEFSRLIFHMRSNIVSAISPNDRMAGEIALREATAYPVTNAFFALCARTCDFDAEENRSRRS